MTEPAILALFPGSPHQNVNIKTVKAAPVALFPGLRPVVDRLQFAYCKQSKTGGGNGLGTRLLTLASFPGLPTFMIAYSKRKQREKAWSISSHD